MASFSTEEFMEEIHKYECLYNRYCKEYKDKFKQLNSWKAVSNKFGLEPSTAEAKFKNVRTAYGLFDECVINSSPFLFLENPPNPKSSQDT